MATIRIPISYEENDMLSFYELIDDPLVILCPLVLKFLSEILSQEDCETVLDFFLTAYGEECPFIKY
jgi:hypothetical protein